MRRRRADRILMGRYGLLFSAVAHGGLLALVLVALAQPKLFASLPEETIEVEVIPQAEIAEPKKLAESKPEAEGATKPQPPPPAQPAPQKSGQAAAATQSASSPEQNGMLITFDAENLMALYNLRLPDAGFDSKANKRAKLTGEEVAAFKANLRRCWSLPGGQAASSTRVVIRVALAANGALSAEPTLVEATASSDGPAVYQAAMRALQQCAPYTALPRDRYEEWKLLDVSFTPREMAGH